MEYRVKSKASTRGRTPALFQLPEHTEAVWAYLAGLLDAGGSLVFKTAPTRVRLQFASTDASLIHKVQALISGGRIEHVKGSKKPCHVLLFESLASTYA